MSHVHEGPLATYNSLTDPNLSGYFGNTRMRRHLRKSGLINRRGEIISENQYRLNMARKEHKKHVKDLLAQAIVHKTLDLERYRQVEIKKKLEEIAKIEMVRRVRASRGRKGDEEVLPYLSPRSHSRPQSSKPSEASSGRRPRSAPSQPRSKPTTPKSGYTDPYEDVIYVDDDGRPVSPPPPSDRPSFKDSLKDVRPENIDTRHLYALDSEALQQYALRLSKAERGRDGASSPYLISPYPHPPKKERVRSAKSPRRGRMSARPDSSRRHGVRSDSGERAPKDPSTVEHEVESPHSEGALMLHRQEPAMMHQGEVQTLCEITMKYHGPNLTLPRDQFDPTQEVSIEQQHCGGNTLPVFKERLQPGSTFSFISRRHRGYPFSLTLYIDGRVDCRVSTCCEYKHGVGVKLGGKMGHFSLTGITGATPCYKCKLSCQAPPRSLKLKKGPPKKKKHDTGEEVTVEGTPRTPITHKKDERDQEVSGKSDEDNYEEDFEDEDTKDKYEDDFEEVTEERDRRHIIGLRDDEQRVNGKTVSVDVTEKEKEQEREGTIPPHRRIEGYSSEDEDAEGPREKSIEVTADVHAQRKEEQPRRRSRSSSSSSSSSSTEREITPRVKPAPQRVRSPSPEQQKVIAPSSPEKVSARSEESAIPRTDRTDRSVTSTTSGSLTTETESTLESHRKQEQPVLIKKRRTSSTSSSSTLTSDSEDERYQRKKREEKLRLENERRRKEEEDRLMKETEEKEGERKKRLEEDERRRQEEEESRKRRFEIQRQESQQRLLKMEEDRKKADLERQQRLAEQNQQREEERKRRQAEEERMKRDYEKQLSLIQSQRESESTLSVSETISSEDQPKQTQVQLEKKPVVEEKRKTSSSSSDTITSEDQPKQTQVEVEKKPLVEAKRKTSSSSSSSESSESESEDETEKIETKTTSPFARAVASFDKKESVQERQKPSSSSSTTTTDTSSTTSTSDTEKDKVPPVQPLKTITEEKKKDERRSSTSSTSSESSSSGGEYMVDTKAQEKKPVIEQPKFTPKPPSPKPARVEEKKESSSSSSSDSSTVSSGSETESDDDNKKVTQPVVEAKPEVKKVETKPEEPPSPQKVVNGRRSSTSSTSSSYSASESESDREFKPYDMTKDPAPFGGVQREKTLEPQEIKQHLPEVQPSKSEIAVKSETVEKEVDLKKEESEDSSSDSSSSSDSDSEDEEKTKDNQGPKKGNSDSEQETMHGGHDPDKDRSGAGLAESLVPTPRLHYGSILPMIKGDNAIDLNGVKLDESQLTEINNYIGQVGHLKAVTLRNCDLDDSSFQNVALALQVTQSCPNLINFSQNNLGAKSMTPLSVAVKNKPSIEILILTGNPVGNVGCKVLMDALVKTKDPFPFLRRSSGYLTPAEARQQREDGKEVDYNQGTSSMECNVRELDLGDTKISDAGIAEISRFLESNKTLVSLNVNGNRDISASGWDRLGQALKKNTTLKTLSLDFTNIGDGGFENLAKGLRSNTSLRCLELENAGLTEKGGQLLRDLLKHNTTIQEVTVTPGNNISDGTLEEIRRYLALNNTSSDM